MFKQITSASGHLARQTISRLNQAYQASKGGGAGKRNLNPSGGNLNRGQPLNQGSSGSSYSPKGFSKRGSSTGYNPRANTAGTRGKLFSGAKIKPVHNTAPKLPYTNFQINTRGTTALSKGLGGTGTVGATKVAASGGYLGVVSQLAASPVGFLAITAYLWAVPLGKKTGDGTLPEHLRSPGEKQVVEEGDPPPFEGGQEEGVLYDVRVELYQRRINTSYRHDPRTLIRIPGAITDVVLRRLPSDTRITQIAVFSTANGGQDPVRTDTVGGVGVYAYIDGISIERTDNQPDTGGNIASSSPGVESESTINYDNIPLPKIATADNVPIGDSFEKLEIPKQKVHLPSPVPTPTPEVPVESNPSPTPTPLPVPEAPPELPLEELDQSNATNKQPSAPKVISETQRMRADGVKETVRQREATPEELRDFKRRVDKSNKEIELEREFRKFKKNINPPDDETDFFYKTADPDPDTGTVEEVEKSPSDKKPKPPTTVPPKKENGEDVPAEDPPEPDDDKIPFIPVIPKPTQSKPDKCRGTCPGKNGVKLDKLNALLSGTGTAQNAGIIKIVQNTNDAVRSTTYGLEKIQGFADTAWKATHADKILNGINTALTIHNAVQLSNNVGATIIETANVALQAAGVEDSDGNPFNVGSVLKSKLNSLLANIGVANDLEAFKTRLAKYNRIYQASANVLDATRDLMDNAVSTAELVAENTGKIGNALIESGAVAENSYDKMVEEFTENTRVAGAFARFQDKLETAENAVSTIGNIAQETVSTKEAFAELKQSGDDWKDEKKKILDDKKVEDEQVKQESTVNANIATEDFDPAPPEE